VLFGQAFINFHLGLFKDFTVTETRKLPIRATPVPV